MSGSVEEGIEKNVGKEVEKEGVESDTYASPR